MDFLILFIFLIFLNKRSKVLYPLTVKEESILMPSPGQELSSIDFESMIGGPLVACVKAQSQSAMSTVNFIKEVGFKKPKNDSTDPANNETRDPIYVKFQYWKETKPYVPGNDTVTPAVAATAAEYQLQYLEVPILTILPIPYLRIDEVTIDFNAKINAVEYQKTDTKFNMDSSLEASAGWLWGSAKLKVSCSYQKNTQQGNQVDRTYSLAIHVKAVQDEMPAGMEKVLGILEDAISSYPQSAVPVRTNPTT
jgi:hypothetical protein